MQGKTPNYIMCVCVCAHVYSNIVVALLHKHSISSPIIITLLPYYLYNLLIIRYI